MGSFYRTGPRGKIGRSVVLLCAGVALSACQNGQGFDTSSIFGSRTQSTGARSDGTNRSVKLVERDVEAPNVFQVTESGLWDGRPSLGGVWVAHPDVKEPERVIIRNSKNDKFVIGALFRRERETPGPRLQVSSDAAAAVGMLAGQPSTLNVTALRRETVADGPAPQPAPETDAPAAIDTATLAPAPETTAARQAQTTRPKQPAAPTTAVAAKPVSALQPAAPRPTSSGLSKPFIQIGIFSVEQNARNTSETMRLAGMVPTVRKSTSKGKTFWRVLVGPAQSTAERATLLKKIKETGFTDAYAVSN